MAPAKRYHKKTSSTAKKSKGVVKSNPKHKARFKGSVGKPQYASDIKFSSPVHVKMPVQPEKVFALPEGYRSLACGPLLTYAISKLYEVKKTMDKDNLYVVAAHMGAQIAGDISLPVILKLPTRKPDPHETWEHYKSRIQEHLSPIKKKIERVMGRSTTELITANAIKFSGSEEQIKILTQEGLIEKIELDPVLQVISMDDVVKDIHLPAFVSNRAAGKGNGSGVSVAVLDSGIDLQHPHLQVSQSASTCGEPVSIPGAHGTHCAGSIASRDALFQGVSPGVTLLNIKVLQANGQGTHTGIVSGIDAALDFQAEILSMSLGFNHLPTWSDGGHGWMCQSGHCPLCTAVDNAVLLDNVIVVVAAGNEHLKAQNLRVTGSGNTFDTELGCPGNAREAITVGAITKTPFASAPFSSHGPTSYGQTKPDLVAPGVNISSTIPVPRDSQGALVASHQRSDIFGRMSGTSMATPIVAGAVALIVQKLKAQGIQITPSNVKQELLLNGTSPWPSGSNTTGTRMLDLSRL